tara:strand:- start:253 stop:582 length:330 start_codon:yes stop_codon:yes gene_type:complete
MKAFKVKVVLILSVVLAFCSVQAKTDNINGEEVYEAKCAACHAEGKAGAPKLDEHTYWQPRLEKGVDALFHNVMNSEHHASCFKCSHREVKEAIKYMATQTGDGNKTLW